ncbi:MAG TPA: monovalent cation/H+ antiporter complex subunit F [Kaistiaceae bacterium]|nr:monovalent cation/H+ antiporter complex subunit F [Kaistiaceae bacterium]
MMGLEIGILGGIAVALLGIAVLLGAARLVLGPTVADRVVAADILTIITTAALVWLALVQDSAIVLDIALVFGALSFVGVVAIARALEKRS